MITVESFTSFIFTIVIGHDDFFFLLTVLNKVQLRGSFTCINNAVAIYFTGTARKNGCFSGYRFTVAQFGGSVNLQKLFELLSSIKCYHSQASGFGSSWFLSGS